MKMKMKMKTRTSMKVLIKNLLFIFSFISIYGNFGSFIEKKENSVLIFLHFIRIEMEEVHLELFMQSKFVDGERALFLMRNNDWLFLDHESEDYIIFRAGCYTWNWQEGVLRLSENDYTCHFPIRKEWTWMFEGFLKGE